MDNYNLEKRFIRDRMINNPKTKPEYKAAYQSIKFYINTGINIYTDNTDYERDN